MASFLDVCRFTPTLGGTTDWTYSAAVTGYQSPTAANAVNGNIYRYRAESADLSQWEIGYGAYNSSTGVFARTSVLFNSSGTGLALGQSGAGTKISFSTVPQVAIIAIAEDFRERLVANRTHYIRYVVGAATFTNASANVTITAHGLSLNDAVIPSILPNKKACAFTNGSPIITMANTFVANQPVNFETTDTLPTNFTGGTSTGPGTTYYVIATGLSGTQFEVSATVGGAAITAGSAGAGTHYCNQGGAMPTFSTAGLLVPGTAYYVKTIVDANNVTLSTTPGGTALGTATVATGLPIYSVASGSDSNDGSSATRTGALLSIQKWYDNLADGYDVAGFTATGQLAAGTYLTGLATSKAVPGTNGATSVVLLGSPTTVQSSNYTIRTTSADVIGLGAFSYGRTDLTIAGIRLQTVTAGNGINMSGACNVQIGLSGSPGCDFGPIAQDFIISNHSGAWIIVGTNNTMSGGATIFAAAVSGSSVALHNANWEATNAPSFIYFGFAQTCTPLFLEGIVITGVSKIGITGNVLYVDTGGIINQGSTTLPTGTNIEYYPGRILGSAPLNGQIPGTITSDNAAAGYIGEDNSVVVAQGSAVALTTGTPKDMCSKLLAAGDYEVDIVFNFTGGATTTVNYLSGCLNTTTADTLDQTNGRFVGLPFSATAVFNNVVGGIAGFSLANKRVSLPSGGTIHAVAQASFGTSTCTVFGEMHIRRAR